MWNGTSEPGCRPSPNSPYATRHNVGVEHRLHCCRPNLLCHHASLHALPIPHPKTCQCVDAYPASTSSQCVPSPSDAYPVQSMPYCRHHAKHVGRPAHPTHSRSEEHTTELQSLMRISYAVFCLQNIKKPKTH